MVMPMEASRHPGGWTYDVAGCPDGHPQYGSTSVPPCKGDGRSDRIHATVGIAHRKIKLAFHRHICTTQLATPLGLFDSFPQLDKHFPVAPAELSGADPQGHVSPPGPWPTAFTRTPEIAGTHRRRSGNGTHLVAGRRRILLGRMRRVIRRVANHLRSTARPTFPGAWWAVTRKDRAGSSLALPQYGRRGRILDYLDQGRTHARHAALRSDMRSRTRRCDRRRSSGPSEKAMCRLRGPGPRFLPERSRSPEPTVGRVDIVLTLSQVVGEFSSGEYGGSPMIGEHGLPTCWTRGGRNGARSFPGLLWCCWGTARLTLLPVVVCDDVRSVCPSSHPRAGWTVLRTLRWLTTGCAPLGGNRLLASCDTLWRNHDGQVHTAFRAGVPDIAKEHCHTL